jgi:hypothetical protein
MSTPPAFAWHVALEVLYVLRIMRERQMLASKISIALNFYTQGWDAAVTVLESVMCPLATVR